MIWGGFSDVGLRDVGPRDLGFRVYECRREGLDLGSWGFPLMEPHKHSCQKSISLYRIPCQV